MFKLLGSKNDSIAIDAFTQLTTCSTAKVAQLCDEYKDADIDKSYAIPIFPYSFLKQIAVLTQYCKNHSIDFAGAVKLKSVISKLGSNLSFSERRKLGDSLIANLTLKEITALEYWALINEQSWGLTYSAGRILDIFYSRNWSKVLNDGQQLNLYICFPIIASGNIIRIWFPLSFNNQVAIFTICILGLVQLQFFISGITIFILPIGVLSGLPSLLNSSAHNL